MGIYKLKKKDVGKIDNLFSGWNETMIWSCLQGYMGTARVDNKYIPKSARIDIADFCFLAGKPNIDLLKAEPTEKCTGFFIMIPGNKAWHNLIEKIYGSSVKKIIRYATKKDAKFDLSKLVNITKLECKDYNFKFIGKRLYEEALRNKWSADLCSQFKTYEEYRELGIGVAALYKGELVSGASSYTVFKDGIEIEVDTRIDHRRKRLALICSAKLILECLKRGIYPSWDAHNKASLSLAQKLGYSLDKEYIAYELNL